MTDKLDIAKLEELTSDLSHDVYKYPNEWWSDRHDAAADAISALLARIRRLEAALEDIAARDWQWIGHPAHKEYGPFADRARAALEGEEKT